VISTSFLFLSIQEKRMEWGKIFRKGVLTYIKRLFVNCL
jgi:hypothetical protein